MDKKLTEDFLRHQAEKTIEKEVQQTWEEGLKKQIDLFDFSEVVYRHYPKKWKQLLGGEKGFALTPDSISSLNVTVKIVESGRLFP